MVVAGFWGQLIAPLQCSENVPSQQDLSFPTQSPRDVSKGKSFDLLRRFVSPLKYGQRRDGDHGISLPVTKHVS